jgi:hypothetical protein
MRVVKYTALDFLAILDRQFSSKEKNIRATSFLLIEYIDFRVEFLLVGRFY